MSTSILLDTDVVIHFLRGVPKAIDHVKAYEDTICFFAK
jgi:hypothetical protein